MRDGGCKPLAVDGSVYVVNAACYGVVGKGERIVGVGLEIGVEVIELQNGSVDSFKWKSRVVEIYDEGL
jgi:hypothetical protein